MRRYTLKRIAIIAFILFNTGMLSKITSQVPIALEKEFIQFNSDIYDALKILNTLNENDAIAKLATVKPELIEQAKSISAQISSLPELNEKEENVFMEKLLEKQLFKDMVSLMSDRSFLNKIEQSPFLQREYEELMEIMDTGSDRTEDEFDILDESQVCSFQIGPPSALKGNYIVTASEEEAFAMLDYENEQFLIEIHGDNYIDILLFVEEPKPGRYEFSAEMQVAIDISTNFGEDYVGFDNRFEERGGYIQLDRIDEVGGMVIGSFQGLFNDTSTEEDTPVTINGTFSVKRM